MAIARGKLKPKPGDPKGWFTSTESFAKVLSNKNRALLATIASTHPVSPQDRNRLLRGHEGANDGDRAGQAQAETGRSQGVVYLDRKFCEGFVEQEPRPARDDRVDASGFACRSWRGVPAAKASNLSGTLKTMEHYGFVRLHRGERGRVGPEVPYQSVSLELPFSGVRPHIAASTAPAEKPAAAKIGCPTRIGRNPQP